MVKAQVQEALALKAQVEDDAQRRMHSKPGTRERAREKSRERGAKQLQPDAADGGWPGPPRPPWQPTQSP